MSLSITTVVTIYGAKVTEKCDFSCRDITMTSSNGNIFHVTGSLCGEFTDHQGQWRRALLFSSICAWTNNWINNRGVGDLRRHRAHHDVTAMLPDIISDNGFHWIVTETLWQLKWQAHSRNSMTMHMTSQIMFIKIRIDLNTKTYM